MTPLIEDYAQRLRAAGRSRYTINIRCRVLRRIHTLLPHGLDGASGDEITAVLATCQTRATGATYDGHLRGYYSTMVAAGHLAYDPMTAVKRPKPGDRTPNPVTDAELVIALDRSPDQPWRLATMLGAYQGMRCGEITRVDREDFTAERVRVDGKGGKIRYVPTHPLVWEHVSPLPTGPVIRGVLGGRVTPEHLTASQSCHWRSIGLPNVHLHRLRHWFGTTLVDQGVGIEVVCELMGHASVATTQGYVRVAQRHRAAAILHLPIMTPEPGSSRLGRATEAA
jgi:integrase/recombinase XerD